MNKQQKIDFLNSILKQRFNSVNTFAPVNVDTKKITNNVNAFLKHTFYGDVSVSVFTYDKNTDTDNYVRVVNFLGKNYKF
jgi:hypothetical protein